MLPKPNDVVKKKWLFFMSSHEAGPFLGMITSWRSQELWVVVALQVIERNRNPPGPG